MPNKTKKLDPLIIKGHEQTKNEIASQQWLLDLLESVSTVKHINTKDDLQIRDRWATRCNDRIEVLQAELKITCICYWFAKSNHGYIGETNQAGCCWSCRSWGGHGDHCENKDKKFNRCGDYD